MARILIIEDDGDLVQLLSLAMFKAGFEVHYAFNGKEGYDKILSIHPDIVVLDLRMPIMAGTEVLKLVSENTLTRDIPIIVMTAFGDKEDLLERSIRAQGARAYIKKPFEIRELLSIVRRTLKETSEEGASPSEGKIVKGAVRLDPKFKTVWINDQRVAILSHKRCALLKTLLQAKGSVKRKKLIQTVWGDTGSENVLDKTIQRLRQDLGPQEGQRIQTTPDGYEVIG